MHEIAETIFSDMLNYVRRSFLGDKSTIGYPRCSYSVRKVITYESVDVLRNAAVPCTLLIDVS